VGIREARGQLHATPAVASRDEATRRYATCVFTAPTRPRASNDGQVCTRVLDSLLSSVPISPRHKRERATRGRVEIKDNYSQHP